MKFKIASAVALSVLLVGSNISEDKSEKIRAQFESVVRIDIAGDPTTGRGGTSASGVVYKTFKEGEQYYAYVLTAKHVADTISLTKDGIVKTMVKVELLYDVEDKCAGTGTIKEWPVVRVWKHPKYDVAVFKVSSRKDELRAIARMHPGTPKSMQKVYTIGMPLGLGEVFTDGHVSYRLDEEVAAKKDYWLTDAQILEGSSGGGVFDENTNALLGITSSALAVGDAWGKPRMIPHLHIFLPITSFVDWLKKESLL